MVLPHVGCHAAAKRTLRDENGIGQCINLSLANMDRNKNLLIITSYFWSDALNAFLFGHGLMAPTLLDVVHDGYWPQYIGIRHAFFPCFQSYQSVENQANRGLEWLFRPSLKNRIRHR